MDRLYDNGQIRKSDFDRYTLDALEGVRSTGPCHPSSSFASTQQLLCLGPADLGDELAECAVQRFSEANFSKISNKNGFFMGIIRRIKQDGPDRDGGDIESLPRSVRHKLLDLIDDVSLPSPLPLYWLSLLACGFWS